MPLTSDVTHTLKEVQERLRFLAFYAGSIDGLWGTKTEEAVKKFQSWRDLTVDGIVGEVTENALFGEQPRSGTPTKVENTILNSAFDKESKEELLHTHEKLQTVLLEARKRIPFKILQSRRGRAEQELAFKRGNSKVHYGDSAHNWSPAIACDCVPIDLDWDDKASFIAVGKMIVEVAKEMEIKVRWLGDPNMDGSTADGWDFPHIELHPWRDYKKESKPYRP